MRNGFINVTLIIIVLTALLAGLTSYDNAIQHSVVEGPNVGLLHPSPITTNE